MDNSNEVEKSDNVDNPLVWSEQFDCNVNAIEGIDIPGERVLIKFDDDFLIEVPVSWVKIEKS